jgi:transposase
MAKTRLSMRKIKEVLRLKHEAGRSHREIAASCGIAQSTVAEYLERARRAGIGWPVPETLSDTALEQQLFQSAGRPPSGSTRCQPDWIEVHRQLRRKGVTLMLLWQEYRERCGEVGYQYSQFANLYRQWLGTLDVVMRQSHRAGEKLFVDYAGQTVDIIDRVTGEIHPAQIFVAVLGASNYTYCEATASQGVQDWVSAHVHTFEFLNGCPEVVVPDNLKSAVIRAHRYEPDLNPTYQDMARHYGVAVVPARVRKPRDKSKAENGVQRVEQWILARLRDRPFFSLEELNRQIRLDLEELNDKPFQKLEGCRRTHFEQLDRPALKPLPAQRYEFAEWLKVRVALNLHIQVAGSFYSVPYALVKKEVEVRLTARTVEVLYKGQRVASHPRSLKPGQYTTVRGHLPQGHQKQLEWNPDRLQRWAADHGPSTLQLITAVLESRPFPQQAFNACLGILRLGQSYGPARLEAACQRALQVGTFSYKSIASILKHGLDQQPLPASTPATLETPTHENVRGANYYH